MIGNEDGSVQLAETTEVINECDFDLKSWKSAGILSGNVDELRLVQDVQVLPPLYVEKLTIPHAAMFR